MHSEALVMQKFTLTNMDHEVKTDRPTFELMKICILDRSLPNPQIILVNDYFPGAETFWRHLGETRQPLNLCDQLQII